MDTKTTGEINADIAPPNTQKKRKAKEISKKVKIAKNIYFITINTNCRPHSKKKGNKSATAIAQCVHTAISLLFTDPYIKQFLKFKKNHDELAADCNYDNTVIDYECKFTVERGKHEKGGAIHAHCLFKLIHKCQCLVHVDYGIVRELFYTIINDTYGSTEEWKGYFQRPYVHVSYKRDLLDYITKDDEDKYEALLATVTGSSD